jgi:hypothetical protein
MYCAVPLSVLQVTLRQFTPAQKAITIDFSQIQPLPTL